MAGTFLEIKGIKGKSRQQGRTNHLDVSTWSLSAQIPVDIDSSKGSLTTGQGWVSDLSCDITCDTSVVQQMVACLHGKHFDEAHLIVTKDVGDKKALDFVIIDMIDVIISGVGLGGSVGGEPSLRIGVKFAKYKMKYILYDEKGKQIEQDTNGFDLPSHVPWS